MLNVPMDGAGALLSNPNHLKNQRQQRLDFMARHALREFYTAYMQQLRSLLEAHLPEAISLLVDWPTVKQPLPI